MTTDSELQKLQPEPRVTLYELDTSDLGGDILRFHGYESEGIITWQGEAYTYWPIHAEGFEITGEGQQAAPTLSVGNLDGTIGALAVFMSDLVGSKLTRRRTLVKYLDGMPEADPETRIPPDVWYIEVKTHHDKEVITWEMRSALDLSDVFLPRRLIVANLCSWRYRSADCGYTGPPVANVNNDPTDNPAIDNCSKSVTGCRLRFGSGNLPFGGFPSASLLRG